MQEHLGGVQQKLEEEILKHEETARSAAAIGNELRVHHREVSRALEDTKRYREANQDSYSGEPIKRDHGFNRQDTGLETENKDEEEQNRRILREKMKVRRDPQKEEDQDDEDISTERRHETREKVLRRHPNDDDNPLVPELRGPPSKGRHIIQDDDEEDNDISDVKEH